jgi:hypothetical protein
MPEQVIPTAVDSVPASPQRAATIAAWVYAMLVAAVLGHFLVGLPIQVSDSFGNMLKLEVSWSDLLVGEFTQRAYLRPFLWAELKLVYDLAGGNYFEWYRGTHVVQIFVLVALFVHLARPRRWADVGALALGLAVLIGLHTFSGTIREAFPINTFLTILICCFAAAAVSLAPYRWWNDVLALIIFVIAALTVESGLLVFVITVGLALVGARGVSRRGVALVVAACAGYFVLRFVLLDVGSPGLAERATGFGFGVLERDEVYARFKDNPLPLYLYNVVSSALSVLFSEPRGGVYRLTWGVSNNYYEPAIILAALASITATAVIGWFAWHRRHLWWRRSFDRDDQLVLLFVMVLGANSVISYPYTKDVIMSAAGAFYALAVYAAVRRFVAASPRWISPRGIATALCCLLLGVTWAVRHTAAHAYLRQQALVVRNEWAYVHSWLERQNMSVEEPGPRALLRQLRDDALIRHPTPPLFPIQSRWFDLDY